MTAPPAGGQADSQVAVPALDRAAIERLRRFGGEKLVAQMIDLFVSTGRERLDAARAAAAAGDCPGVQRPFHALKSSAGQLGAVLLQALCERGEMLAAQGAATSLPSVVSAAHEQFIVAVRLLQGAPWASGAVPDPPPVAHTG